jgi:hypothetical protein
VKEVSCQSFRGHGDCITPAAVSSLNSPRRNFHGVESSCDSDSGGAFRTRRCCGGTEYGQHGQQQLFEPERDRQQQVLGQRFRRCFEQLLLAEQQLLVLAERGFAELVFAEFVFFVVLAERIGWREQLQQLDPDVLLGRHERRRLDLAPGVGRALQQVRQQLQLLERRHVEQQLAEHQLAEQQHVAEQQHQVAEQQRHGQLELRFGHEQRLQQLRNVRLEHQQVRRQP